MSFTERFYKLFEYFHVVLIEIFISNRRLNGKTFALQANLILRGKPKRKGKHRKDLTKYVPGYQKAEEEEEEEEEENFKV